MAGVKSAEPLRVIWMVTLEPVVAMPRDWRVWARSSAANWSSPSQPEQVILTPFGSGSTAVASGLAGHGDEVQRRALSEGGGGGESEQADAEAGEEHGDNGNMIEFGVPRVCPAKVVGESTRGPTTLIGFYG